MYFSIPLSTFWTFTGIFRILSYSSQEKSSFAFFPFLSRAFTTKRLVAMSLKFPMWMEPEGLMPAAQTYSSLSGFLLMIFSAILSDQCIIVYSFYL